MDEIDKKIEEGELLSYRYEKCWDEPLFFAEDGRWIMGLLDDYIYHLKKCRSNYGDLYQRLKSEIEQRTKEACKKAGWNWYINITEAPQATYTYNSFEQAIDEAKGE